MLDVVRGARAAGIRTGLLSNSWGLDYERDGWDALFDAVVISGEVGLRKPDPAIYALAAERLDLPPEQIVFVDDLRPNVRAAAATGMVGVQHVDLETTVSELEILFDTSLRWARKMAQQAPLAIERIKRVSGQGLEAEAQAFGEVFGSDDAREGIGAFLGKKTPKFQGK